MVPSMIFSDMNYGLKEISESTNSVFHYRAQNNAFCLCNLSKNIRVR